MNIVRLVQVEVQWCAEHVGLPGDVIVPAGFGFHDRKRAFDDARGAAVNVHHLVEPAEREAARADTAALRQEFIERGALIVVMEEEVVPSIGEVP